MRLFKYLFFFLLIAQPVFAQSTNWLASYQVSNGVNQPVSTSTPLPVGVYGGSSATSGYCLTSNGPGSVATFQVCGGGGTLPVANGGTGASSQTTNGIAYYNGTAIATGTSLVYNSGNVGIGTATPQYPLDVNGVVNSATGYYLNGSSTASYGASQLLGATAGQFSIYNHSSNAAAYTTISGGGSSAAHLDLQSSYGTGTTDYIRFLTGSETEQMRITSSGAIGIGTTTISASNKLEVNGAASIGYVDTAAPSGGLIVSGNVGIGTATLSASNELEVNGAATIGYVDIAAPTNGMAISGYVDIGTTVNFNTAPLLVYGTGTADIYGVSTSALGGGSGGGVNLYEAAGTPSATDQRLGFYTMGVNIGTAYYNGTSVEGFTSESWSVGSAQGAYMVFKTTGNAATSRTEKMRIEQGGDVDIGTTVGVSVLTVAGLASASETDILCYGTSNGAISYATAVSGCVPSDIRIKNIIENIKNADGLMDISPIAFTYKDTATFGTQEYVGLSAQEVCKLDSRLCITGKDGTLNYDQRGLTAYMVVKIKDQQHEIDNLREQIHATPRKCNIFCQWRETLEGL